MDNDADDDAPADGRGVTDASGRRWRLIAALAVVAAVATILVVVIVNDDDGDDDDAATATPTTAADASTGSTGGEDSGATTTVSSQSSTTAAAAGCTGSAPEIGEPNSQTETVDIDGDGRRDTAWLASPGGSGRELGVVTAAGGGDKVMIDSASPSALTLLVAEADDRPPVELFVSDNRAVQLWTFSDCSLQPVTDDQGEPYLFDLGFRATGTGVGCVDADGDGRRDLVGLNITDSDDTTIHWSRTIIERDGLRASNGATDTGQFDRIDDAARIELLTTVSCGSLTIDQDGIRQPER